MAYKMLIVDDSAVVRAVLKKTIGMIELPIETLMEASNGKEALEILKDNAIDIILADLNMPEMNGIELTNQVLSQENANGPVPAIVIITTERNDVRIQELRDKGIKGYVHKPFTPEHIKSTLEDVLGCSV